MSRYCDAVEDDKSKWDQVDMEIPNYLVTAFALVILLPSAIYFTYNYYNRRHEYIYKTRRPLLVLVFCSLALFAIGIYVPFHIIVLEVAWQNNNTYNEYWDSYLFNACQFIIYVAYILRAWHTFYDFKLNKYVSDTHWKEILNRHDAAMNETDSWYVEMNHRYNNPRFTFIVFLVIPLAIYLVVFAIVLILETGCNAEYVVLFLIMFVQFVAIVCMQYVIYHFWNNVLDNIYLRSEILLGCVIITTSFSIEVIIFAVDIIGGFNKENEYYQQVFNFLFNITLLGLSFGLLYVSTRYVSDQLYRAKKAVSRTVTVRYEEGLVNQGDIELVDVLKSPSGFRDFLDHLAQNCSINMIVFVIEVTQLKRKAARQLQSHKDKKIRQKTEEMQGTLLEFPESVPDSEIIYPNSGFQMSSTKIYFALFDKYIVKNGPWPINLSPKTYDVLIEKYRRLHHSVTFTQTNIHNVRPNPRALFSIGSKRDTPIDSNSSLPPIENNNGRSTMLTGLGSGGDAMEKSNKRKKELLDLIELLDKAYDEVYADISELFDKFKMLPVFETWFANLTNDDKMEMNRERKRRLRMADTKKRKHTALEVEQWKCQFCSKENRKIKVGGVWRKPKNLCVCCGCEDEQKKTKKRKKMNNMSKGLSVDLRGNFKRKPTMLASFICIGAPEKDTDNKYDDDDDDDEIPHLLKEADSDESVSLSSDSEVKFLRKKTTLFQLHKIDDTIAKEWEEMIYDIQEKPKDNECEPEAGRIDDCPQVQKFLKIMKYYKDYCNSDVTQKKFKIESMPKLINNLKDFTFGELNNAFYHIMMKHWNEELFEIFDDEYKGCAGGDECKPLQRNTQGRKTPLQRNNRKSKSPSRNRETNTTNRGNMRGNTNGPNKKKKKRVRINISTDGGSNIKKSSVKDRIKQFNKMIKTTRNLEIKDDTDTKEEEPRDSSPSVSPFPPVGGRRMQFKRTMTRSRKQWGDVDDNKNPEDRITLQFLDKMHAFVFHSEVKERINYIPKNMTHNDEMKGDEKTTDGPQMPLLTSVMSNKFVTDVSKLAKHKSDRNEESVHEYYEYGFGKAIDYLTAMPDYICLKNELLYNNIHNIDEGVWDDILTQALVYCKMKHVKEHFKAIAHALAEEYGIKENEPIGVSSVVAILCYCNLDTLQSRFSSTFRKVEDDDTDENIVTRHCSNFYWFGRALFVAIHFFGQNMNEKDYVWHGMSTKMLFDNFATFFDCPTSTTTQRTVAQKFSGGSSGIILKLKSQYKTNCSRMLDVSQFSNFPDECERLFLGQTLIITDVLQIEESTNQWKNKTSYVLALLYFNKLTTGNVDNGDWNNRETDKIQTTLHAIIIDYLTNTLTGKKGKTVPEYISKLFEHYCSKKEEPIFRGLDRCHNNMIMGLRGLLFDQAVDFTEKQLCNKKQKISETIIKTLFPNCKEYINDQNQKVTLVDGNGVVDINRQSSGEPSNNRQGSKSNESNKTTK